MKLSSSEPTYTTKWHIEVPTNTYESIPTLYKVWFGQKFLIWKGKYLLQSCESLAESIERYIRLQKNDQEDQMHHVCAHIKKARCIKATVEVISNEYQRTINGSESINGYALLADEQKLLDKHRNDAMCLNNNIQAYIPKWITKAHETKFLEFYSKKNR